MQGKLLASKNSVTIQTALSVSRWVIVAQSCPTLCDPMYCSPPGSSVHGILQARVLERVAISSSQDIPDPGIEPVSSAWQADSFLLSHLGRLLPVYFSSFVCLFSVLFSLLPLDNIMLLYLLWFITLENPQPWNPHQLPTSLPFCLLLELFSFL